MISPELSRYAVPALAALLAACTTPPSSGNWQQLFVGDQSGWSTVGDADWSLDDQVLTASNATTNSFIVTNQTYDDFRLQLEFYPVGETNSGVYMRCERDKITPADCYEANIADNHQNKLARTGSLVGHTVPKVRSETVDRWNSYEIIADGNHITIWINGVQTSTFESATIPEGLIALQLFGKGEVRFRNIRIQEL